MAGNPKTKAQIEAERKRKTRSPASPPAVPGKTQKKNFDAGVKGALANMTPAQKKAYEKSLGKSAASSKRRVEEDKFLESGGTKSKDYAKKPAKKETFGQAFARERKAQGAGGTFTYKGKKFTTDRADDKPAKAPEKKGFFRKLGDGFKKATTTTPGRPRKPSGKKPMRTPSTGPWAKYDRDMKAFRKKQEAAKGKASGGRVTAKKPTAKKPTAKKPMARTSVKKRMPRRP